MRAFRLLVASISALFLTLLTACGGGSGSTPIPVAPPVIASFTTDKAALTAGQTAQLTPVFSGGSGSISNSVGTVQSNVAVTVAPTVTTTYVLTVTNAAGATDSKGVVVAVVAAPTIASFTASPTSITAGQSSVLSPNFSGGTGAVNQSIGAVTNGVPVVVTPAVTTTYVLTVTNSTGATTTAGALVMVVGSPTITSFTATPTQITAGQTSVLLGVFSGGNGVVTPTVGVVGSGSPVSVAPTVTTTYALTVTNSAGANAMRTAIVNVVSGPFNISLSANPALITVGDSSTLIPTFSGGAGTIDNGVGAVASGIPFAVTPAVTTTYTLTVDNGAGVTDQRGVIVTVVAKPVIITFGNSPTTITQGATTTLNAVYTGGTGVVSPGVGAIASGSAIQVSPSSTTTYTLTVTNAAGYSVFKTLSVIVLPPAGANSFTANPPVITLGGCSNLLAVFSGGSGNINQGIGLVTSGVPVTVCPIVTTTYTLTVVNGAGGSSSLSATVTVVTAPICSMVFNANPPGAGLNIPEGGSGNLVPTFPTGTGVISGVGTVLTGVPYPVNPVVNTTYILTVTNAAGAVCTSSLTVTIIPNPRITSFTANPPTITAGSFSNLIGVFTGAGPLATDAIIRDQVPTTLFTGVQSGTVNSVNPAATTTYTLVVKNLLGVTANASITVTVIPAPSITIFEQCNAAGTGTPNVPITVGDTAYLHGTFINGTGQVDHGIGNFLSGLTAPTAVNPTQSTTYTLTVTNSAGATALANATIVVLTGPNASAIIANPIYVTNLGVNSSQTTFITPFFTVGTFGTATVTAKEAISNAVVAVPAALTTPLTGVPVGVNTLNVDTVFTLTVSNGATPPVTTTQGVVVHVLPLPTAVLTTNGTPASNPIITKGNSVGLLPTFTPTTGVTAIITPGVGAVATGGTYSVSPLVTTTYTLTVTNAAGYSVSSSVTVVVVDGPFAAAFYASPASIRVGQSTTFFAIFNPLPPLGTATVTDLVPSGAPGFPYTPVSGLGVVKGPFATAGVFQFRLNLNNGAGGIQDVYTTLTVAPALTAIALGTNVVGPPAHTITKGQTINLLPTWAPVGLGNGSIDNGVGAVINGYTYTVAPQITTTYTLTVTDSAGVAGTTQRTVTVLDGPFASSVSANPLLITDGDTTYLTSVFNNPGPLGSASLTNTAVAGGGTTTPASPQVPVSGVATPYAINFGGTLATPKQVVFNLGVTNGATPVVTSNQSVVVTVYQAPVITSFTASAPSIGLGSSSNLLPVFRGGAANIISGGGIFSIGNVTSGGAYTVSPAFTTAYTLTVTNPAGRQVVATTTVNVIQPPVIDSFTAAPPIITAGQSTSLYPVFHNAAPADASITPGIPAPVTSGVAIVVTPAFTTTYTLVVANLNGSATATTTVTVVPPPQAVINGPITAFVTQPNLIYTVAPQAPGTTYNWSVDNGGIITSGFGTNQITVKAGNLPGAYVAATSGMRVSIAVTNAANSTVTGFLNVTLTAVVAPTATLTATPPSVETGQTTVLNAAWTGSVITGVINPGNIFVNVGGGSPQAITVGPLSATTVYTLTVTGPTALTATAQATVSLIPAPTITSFTASPTIITNTSGVANLVGIFTRDFGVGASANVTLASGPGPLASTPATSGVAIPFSSATSGTSTFSLTVTNSAGTAIVRQASVTVVDAPVATSLLANGVAADLTISQGSTATLQPNFTGGTGVISPTVGSVTTAQNYAVTPSASTTYTLTVTNAAGATATRVRTITVISSALNVSLLASKTILTQTDTFTLTPGFLMPPTVNRSLVTTAGGGTMPAANSFSPGVPIPVTPTILGTYVYTLSADNGAGTTGTAGVTVTVVAAPVITSFTANGGGDVTVNAGDTVALVPTFTGGTGNVSGLSPVTSGQTYNVTPTATTTYDLTVTNAAGTVATANRTVTVLSGQYASSLTATPNLVTVNTVTNIQAIFTAPTGSTVALAGDANGGLASLTPTSGASYPATPTTVGAHTYTLTITPLAGPVYTRSVTINVVAAPGATLTITGPASIASGSSTTLQTTVTNGNGVLTNVGSVVNGATYTVSPTSTTTYTLTVTNAAGTSATSTQTVTVVTGPFAMSLQANPTALSPGDTVTISPTFNVGTATGPTSQVTFTGADFSNVPATPVTVATGVPFQEVVAAYAGAPKVSTFTLTVSTTGPVLSSSTTASVIIYALPTAAFTLPATATVTINPGTAVPVTPTFTGGVGVVTGLGTVTSGTAYTVYPTATGDFTLTVTSPAGRIASAMFHVIVNPTPGVPSLTSNKTVVTNGSTALLTATWTPNSATGSIAPAPGAVTNGVPVSVTPPSNATTSYTLTVTSGGSTATAGVAITAVPLPSALSLTPTPASIQAGGTSTLAVAFTGGVSATVNQGVGPVTNGGSYGVSPATTTTYTLTVLNAAGDSATTTATVTVVQAPTITSFTANPTTITAGSGTTYLTGIFSTGGPGGSAQITGSGGPYAATSGVGVPVTGLAAGTYTFQLNVSNSVPTTVSSSVVVTVVAAPTATSLLANGVAADLTISQGSTATLQPNFSNGTGVVSPTVGTVVTGANYAVTPLASTTYTLTVTNAAGATATLVRTITVVSSTLNVSLLASRNLITFGDAFTLTPGFTIPAGGTATITSTVNSGAVSVTVTSGNGVPVPVTPAAVGTYIYTLTANNGAGTTATAGVSVTVVAAPATVSLTALPVVINAGDVSVLTASAFTGGTGVITPGNVAIAPSGTINVSPTATTTYTLTVTNAAGASLSSNATVTVLSGQYASSLTATPSTVTVNTSTFIQAIFTAPAGATVALAGDTNGGLASLTPTSGGSYAATPTTTGAHTYTLTITPASGPVYTRSVTVNVVAAPTAALSALPTTITAGQSSVLSTTVTGGTGFIPGIGSVVTGSYTVNPTSTTTYSLTVTNAAGTTATAIATVTVVAGPLAVSLQASPAAVSQGDIVYVTPVYSGNVTSSSIAYTSADYTVASPVANPTSGVPVPLTVAAYAGAPKVSTFTLTANSTTPALSSSTTASVIIYALPTAAFTLPATATVTINPGGSVAVTPSFTNGTGTFTGLGTVTNGTAYTIYPTASGDYTLTVTNPAGRIATAMFHVTVNPLPGTATLTSNKVFVTNGNTATLTPAWNPNSGTGSIAPAPGVVSNGVPVTVTPPSGVTTVYTLTVTSGANTSTAGVAITAVPLPSALSLTPAPATITAGQSSNLTVAFTGGVSATVTGVGNVVNGGVYTVTPAVTTTYTLTVLNAAGDFASATGTVTVLQSPLAISLAASPQLITVGDSFQMTANWASGTATITSPQTPLAGAIPASGSFFNGVPFTLTPTGAAGTYQYQLAVVNGATTATTGVFVTVVAAPTATLTSNPPAPATLATGANITLTCGLGGGSTSGILKFPDGTTLNVLPGQVVSVTMPAGAPGSTFTWTLYGVNAAGKVSAGSSVTFTHS